MSSDFYIDIKDVVSRPALFKLKAAVNGDVDQVVEALADDEPDYEWIESLLEPVLMCTFGAGQTRYVRVIDGKQLHICCAAHFAQWLTWWLDDLDIPYETAE